MGCRGWRLSQAPQHESDFQQVIEVPEEEEPAPKRKKVMSVAARAWGAQAFALLGAFRRREGPRRRVPPKDREKHCEREGPIKWQLDLRAVADN